MKLFQFIKDNSIHVGVINNDNQAIDINEYADNNNLNIPNSLKEIIENWNSLSSIIEEIKCSNTCIINDEIDYAPVINNPEKIICVGLNYLDHINEHAKILPEYPVLFCKFPTSLNAHNKTVYLDPEYIEYDYEAELVIVIGKQGKNISKDDAKNYVFGYTCGNDISNRYLQQNRSGQWLNGKAIDGFAPVGPVIETECDGDNLSIKGYLNDELKQNANTNQMIFDISTLVNYISKTITLKPGDLIFTGTPSGVIVGTKEKIWMKPGDTYKVEIEDIGVLKNTMV